MLLTTAAGATPALPPFDLGRIVTEAGIDPLPMILTVWVAGAYLVGVRVLRARGDRWSWGRTFSFVVVGMGSFAFATMSGLGRTTTSC